MPLLVGAALAVGVAVTAAFGISDVQGNARSSLRDVGHTQTVLAHANALNAIEWRAMANGAAVDESRDDAREEAARLMEDVDRIPGDMASSAALRTTAGAYSDAVGEQLAALAAGDRERAEEIDETRVDPGFEALSEAIEDSASEATRRADRAAGIGNLGTLAILIGAALALVALFWRLDRLHRLAYQAYHDPLTRLANRSLLTERLTHALELANRRGEAVGVAFVDIDDFKNVNDSLGHQTGDALLVAIGERIALRGGSGATVARFGGDEFVIMLDELGEAGDVDAFCHRLLDEIQLPITLSGRQLVPRATIGYALSDPHAETTADDLLRNADLAMYSGKRAQKGTVTAFAPEMHTRVLDELELEGELRFALERGELALHYQPVVSLDTGALRSTEALLRWTHPRLGSIAPEIFIPMAERTGLIHEIGEWVLREACRQTAEWHADHRLEQPIAISVNVSAVQLRDTGLVNRVYHALTDAGLPAHHLTIEITESIIAEGNDIVRTQLTSLRGLRVNLAIDDFGTGYSSLSTLHQFPVNVLKIDRGFVEGVEASEERRLLLASIIEIGRSLGLTTVAEGVEHASQVQALSDLGFVQAQGYHFARPLSAGALRELFDDPILPAGGTRSPVRDVLRT